MSLDRQDAEGLSSTRTAAIVGVAGTVLSAEEQALFRDRRPTGFILFARNCVDPDQLTALIDDLRSSIDDAGAPVLIDQEGGRVARLKPPHWRRLPPLRRIGELALQDPEAARKGAWLHARLLAADLEPLGITVNCAPVLDLGLAGQTDAIGDRALSDDPELVAVLGRQVIEGHLAGGVLPVIKHLPGHGRAMVDSHKDLPCVTAARSELAEADWLPFKANAAAPFGMTAHILFEALDRSACTTQSETIIRDVIRREIGFAGALLSDDLSMEALGGSLGERAKRARQAGCDLALHCNGDLAEMTAVLEMAGSLDGDAAGRVDRALAERRSPEPFDADDGQRRLEALLTEAEPPAEAVG